MGHTVTDLHEVAGRLIGEAQRAASGRAAETIFSGSVQRSTVVALTADAEMGEHDSPPAPRPRPGPQGGRHDEA